MRLCGSSKLTVIDHIICEILFVLLTRYGLFSFLIFVLFYTLSSSKVRAIVCASVDHEGICPKHANGENNAGVKRRQSPGWDP